MDTSFITVNAQNSIRIDANGTIIYTMDYKTGAELINVMKPKVAIPTHYGTAVGKPEDGEKFAKLVDECIQVEIKLSISS